MKAKIYPLEQFNNDIPTYADFFCLHLSIICASLAEGITTITNTTKSKSIDTTIKWCRNIGANIKIVNDKIIVNGVNNTIKYNTSLFDCENSDITAKLMIPLLSLIPQPFGIKASDEVLQSILENKELYEKFNLSVYLENKMIRFEKELMPIECEIDGDIDISLVAGLLIALPLTNNNSIIKLRAPIRSEATYNLILKVLKKFHVDIKHPASMQYEIFGYQQYKHCKIKTETSIFMLCNLSLLSQRNNNKKSNKISNYQNNIKDEYDKLLDFFKKNVIYFSRKRIRKKELCFQRVSLQVENSLPLLMVLALINNNDCVIDKVDLSKPTIYLQYQIMKDIFDKFGVQYTINEKEIMIHALKIDKKYQVDCQNNPYVVIALTMLALLSKHPIIIKNVDCIYNYNQVFFDDLLALNAKIEFIHN